MNIKRIAIISEVRCSTLMAKIFELAIINIAGFMCAYYIRKAIDYPLNDKIRAYSTIKFWYIFSMAYSITVLMIMFILIYFVIEENMHYLTGIISPVGICTVGGMLFLDSALSAFSKSLFYEDSRDRSHMIMANQHKSKEMPRENDGVIIPDSNNRVNEA